MLLCVIVRAEEASEAVDVTLSVNIISFVSTLRSVELESRDITARMVSY